MASPEIAIRAHGACGHPVGGTDWNADVVFSEPRGYEERSTSIKSRVELPILVIPIQNIPNLRQHLWERVRGRRIRAKGGAYPILQ